MGWAILFDPLGAYNWILSSRGYKYVCVSVLPKGMEAFPTWKTHAMAVARVLLHYLVLKYGIFHLSFGCGIHFINNAISALGKSWNLDLKAP